MEMLDSSIKSLSEIKEWSFRKYPPSNIHWKYGWMQVISQNLSLIFLIVSELCTSSAMVYLFFYVNNHILSLMVKVVGKQIRLLN